MNIFGNIRNIMTAALIGVSMSVSAQKFEFFDPDSDRSQTEGSVLQLRTNLLHDAVLCPNIGLEVQFGNGLAWQLDYGEAWWNSFETNKFYSVIYFQTEIRKYFGKWSYVGPYRGHHVGVYLQMGAFDLENGGKGYISPELDKNVGFGLSYGYSFRLNNRLSIDCTLGAGYASSVYEGYNPVGKRYVSTGWRKKTWIGPTKLEASLVWNISKKNKNRR